ncbi:crotonase/enoyl-CoA hydratase family protein [Ferrimonas lipolytica]|uniref:Crotonase/enoyl-CoA hydratase family protein n=1 Tax=Ferrimonas lipolytica TaxID=2724191 RepID=A0A6H1UIY6_9GAMM|nr:crotonase/enoyl-CoA hydratase family protein [Ferrimonas lipolytica]QIZ77762.1 crotonase/enoyl-CoA hydratase family protein [Ferrimonas lipolytica]
MEQRIECEIIDSVAVVTLQRPDKHNALDMAMFKAIIAVQKRLAKQHELRGVILTGAGVDFCTGIDVKSLLSDAKQAAKLLWKWWPGQANMAQRVSTGWRDLPVPVMAVLHGKVWGGGLQIALGADFRYGQPDCTLSVMEGRWGLLPDMGGNLAMREQMNQDQALWLAMSADVIDAEQAKAQGLLTELCDDPMALAQQKMAELLQRSPDALAATKRLYRRHGVPKSGRMLAAETFSQWRLVLGKNQRIAVAKQQGKERDYLPRQSW